MNSVKGAGLGHWICKVVNLLNQFPQNEVPKNLLEGRSNMLDLLPWQQQNNYSLTYTVQLSKVNCNGLDPDH